jgi:ADP-ribose pyrophosphatase YjhB (NUDIX family)
MINFYVDSIKSNKNDTKRGDIIDANDTNKVLKLYYKFISESKPKPTIVICVSIINKKNKVLIGLRKDKNKYVKDLKWTFPSGQLESLDFEKKVVASLKEETGFNCKVNHLLHARLIPDSPNKPVRIIALYYYCRVLSGTQKAGGDFKELKWVLATEVNRYFTTSVSDEIMQFLGSLS